MTISRFTVVALAAAGVTWSAPAAADPDLFGAYTFEAEDGESATWTLTPCAGNADGCVRVAETGNAKRAPWSADAHISVGSWILLVQQPDAILCEDGSAAPGLNTYSWDAVSLSGSASLFSNGACGAGPESLSIPFTLTRTGAGPVQYPTAPVDVEPYVPQDSVPAGSPSPPPAGTLPAESPAGEVAVPAVIPPARDQLTEAEVAQPGFNR